MRVLKFFCVIFCSVMLAGDDRCGAAELCRDSVVEEARKRGVVVVPTFKQKSIFKLSRPKPFPTERLLLVKETTPLGSQAPLDKSYFSKQMDISSEGFVWGRYSSKKFQTQGRSEGVEREMYTILRENPKIDGKTLMKFLGEKGYTRFSRRQLSNKRRVLLLRGLHPLPRFVPNVAGQTYRASVPSDDIPQEDYKRCVRKAFAALGEEVLTEMCSMHASGVFAEIERLQLIDRESFCCDDDAS